MSWDLNGQTANVEQALAGGAPQRAGWFRFYFADQRWEWSEQVQRMHGYEPGTVTPTTKLVLEHKHPEDRKQVAATIDQILNTHKAFSTRHRIIDTIGEVHHVVVVGDELHDNQGDVIGTHGFYVDVTPTSEQAKGMLMLVYGIGDTAAFELLKWLSQEANVKLRPLAERICEDFRSTGRGPMSQPDFDHLLLTAHQRVGHAEDPPA
jgi:PAS domain S-box-containing protein